MIESINLAILIGAALVAASAFTSVLAQRLGAPLLLLFLGIGLLAGEDGLLGIDFDDDNVAYFIGSLALVIILFDAGFDTPVHKFRLAGAPALVLATVGVVITAGIVGAFAHMLFSVGWLEGLTLGAIVASTDAAAVFFLLRVGGIDLRERIAAMLEVESGSNDPIAIFLTVTLVELATASNHAPAIDWHLALIFLQQIGLGLICGVAGGVGIAWLLNRLRELDVALYPIAALSMALIVYAATAMLGGSGFLAAYVAGAVAGNRRVRYAARVRRFQIGMSWLAQIGMFLTLGLLATPSEFESALIPAIVLSLVLIFVARPVAVVLCLWPFPFSVREVLFTGWVGLRGAVSILLAILPSIGGMPMGYMYFNIVFVMVLSSMLVQGWTVRIAANLFRMTVPPRAGPVDRIDLELPGSATQELVGYRIHPDSSVARGERVPRWARPTLVLRGGRSYSIHTAGPLQAEDRVYLFASPRQIQLLDRIYAAPAAADASAFWGDVGLVGDVRLGELSEMYGAEVEPEDAEVTVGELFKRTFAGRPEAGDRLMLGRIELVVRQLGEDGAVTEAGLVLDGPRGEEGAAPVSGPFGSLLRRAREAAGLCL